jgi:transposase-like protein
MGKLVSQEQLQQYIAEHGLSTVADAQQLVKELLGDTLQAMLEAELTHTLGHPKGGHSQTGNRRNGHSPKTVRTESGDVTLAIPRDREGAHTPTIVPKHHKSLPSIEDQIIALYSKGMSTRDIQDHLQQVYGLEVSPMLVSTVTARLLPVIETWQRRPLAATYAVVFLDAIHFKVRDGDRVTAKAAYVVLGIDLEGRKDILGFWLGAQESAKFWLGVLTDLRQRGVQDILIACTDNLAGFSEAIAAQFPQTAVQKCVVHQIRASIKYVAEKDVKAVLADLRPIYTAATEEAALAMLDRFAGKWGPAYPWAVKSWRGNWAELATCFAYPPEVRKLIYTTNTIESFHRQLRKVTKTKGAFPTEEALVKQLYLAMQDITRKWTMRLPHWGQILLQLSILFPERVHELD